MGGFDLTGGFNWMAGFDQTGMFDQKRGFDQQGSYFDWSKLKKTSPVVKNGFNRVFNGQNGHNGQKQEKNHEI